MKQLPWILVGVLTAALLFSLFFRGCAGCETQGGDTVWLPVRVDTLRDTVIAPPVSERPAGFDTARLPVFVLTECPDSAAEWVEDTSSFSVGSPAKEDSAEVVIPITEKEYQTDDYRIVISGYRPRLVSAEFYRHTQTGVVNPVAPKRKRWGLGFSVGMGVGISGKPEPFIGVTLNYNLLQW